MELTQLDNRTHLACDIGSNAVRILLGSAISDGTNIRVQKQSLLRLPVRLGDDVFRDGSISQAKIDRLVEVCGLLHPLKRIYQAASVQVCATSAVRESANLHEVLDALKKRGGVNLEVIDGDQEASLVQLVIQHLHLAGGKNQLFIDVGGGSTELVHFSNDTLQTRRSFKVGTVRTMLEKVPVDEWQRLKQWLLQEHCNQSELVVIGTGGTINTMSKIVATPDKDLSLVAIEDFISRAKNMTVEARQLCWDLRKDKADVIVHGCGIYTRIMGLLGVDSIKVPRMGLVDALVLKAAMGEIA